MSDSNVENATKIQNEIEALRRLAATVPNDPLAQASIAGQINALEWARAAEMARVAVEVQPRIGDTKAAMLEAERDVLRAEVEVLTSQLAESNRHHLIRDDVDAASNRRVTDREATLETLRKLVEEAAETISDLIGDDDAEEGVGDGEGHELAGVGLYRLGIEFAYTDDNGDDEMAIACARTALCDQATDLLRRLRGATK